VLVQHCVTKPCNKLRLYWWNIVTRFRGSGDISEKLVSHIKPVPWINMLLNATYSGWISHFVNQHGYLKSVRKSKLRCLFPRACWSLFDAMKCHITQLQRFSTATQLVTSLDACQQSLIIIVIIFICIIIITSAFVKCKINRTGIESFHFPRTSLP